MLQILWLTERLIPIHVHVYDSPTSPPRTSTVTHSVRFQSVTTHSVTELKKLQDYLLASTFTQTHHKQWDCHGKDSLVMGMHALYKYPVFLQRNACSSYTIHTCPCTKLCSNWLRAGKDIVWTVIGYWIKLISVQEKIFSCTDIADLEYFLPRGFTAPSTPQRLDEKKHILG